MVAAGRTPVMILFYHRISDDHLNDWTLPTRNFAQQIEWLRRHTDLVSLEEAQRRLASGHNTRPTACITFDDGYADNCRFALPLLMRHQVPVTYFVSLQHVVERETFPHDKQAGVSLATNTIDELRGLASAGVEIGHHTRRHTDLGKVTDESELYDELVESGRELAAAVDQRMRFFAFPYGLHANLNARAFHMAREAGYLGVCSAYGGYNFPGDDTYHLQRFHADPEWSRFKNWVTIDPRKLSGTQRYDYGLPVYEPVATESVPLTRLTAGPAGRVDAVSSLPQMTQHR
jgi:peptidoglycan/xylan/chitin deacetylase (PgdA/CDA1 family)